MLRDSIDGTLTVVILCRLAECHRSLSRVIYRAQRESSRVEMWILKLRRPMVKFSPGMTVLRGVSVQTSESGWKGRKEIGIWSWSIQTKFTDVDDV